MSRDSSCERTFDLQEPTVKLCTIHSAKGLDFEVVFLVDVSNAPLPALLKCKDVNAVDPHYRNLVFVGSTRARERLSLLLLRP